MSLAARFRRSGPFCLGGVVAAVLGCQSTVSVPDLEAETWEDIEEIVAELKVVPPEVPSGEGWERTRVALTVGTFAVAEDVSVAPRAVEPTNDRVLARVGFDDRLRALIYERGRTRLSCKEENLSGEELDACEAVNDAGGASFTQMFLSDPIPPDAMLTCARNGEERCPATIDGVEDRCGL